MLIDTSGLYRYFNKQSAHHDAAKTFFQSALERVTHNYILAEFVALSNIRGLDRKTTFDFSSWILDTPLMDVIFVDGALHSKALTLLENRIDKNWSLCDAVSFVLMKDRSITEALTTDRHFEQAGFVRLLKP